MEHLVCTGFLIHQTEFQQNFRLIHHKLCYKYRHSAFFYVLWNCAYVLKTLSRNITLGLESPDHHLYFKFYFYGGFLPCHE